MMATFLMMLGGSLGALSRYYLGILIMEKFTHTRFPIAMIVINGVGSLGLGLLIGSPYANQYVVSSIQQSAFQFLSVGFFGAFTTFSTFSVEAITLWKNAEFQKFYIYLLFTVLLSVGSFSLGIYLTN